MVVPRLPAVVKTAEKSLGLASTGASCSEGKDLASGGSSLAIVEVRCTECSYGIEVVSAPS